ncbi:MAG: hypothetical protein JWL59_5123 [Chthoniobacteraceae bacterium]|nr:hypothetical protein [Chthoniobacteraceae bacterium]
MPRKKGFKGESTAKSQSLFTVAIGMTDKKSKSPAYAKPKCFRTSGGGPLNSAIGVLPI